MTVNMYLSIITLNISHLNAPIQRHWVTEWIRRPTYTLATTEPPQNKRHTQTESKVMGKKIHLNGNEKKRLG